MTGQLAWNSSGELSWPQTHRVLPISVSQVRWEFWTRRESLVLRAFASRKLMRIQCFVLFMPRIYFFFLVERLEFSPCLSPCELDFSHLLLKEAQRSYRWMALVEGPGLEVRRPSSPYSAKPMLLTLGKLYLLSGLSSPFIDRVLSFIDLVK